MEIENFNPWWETGSVEKEILGYRKRGLFSQLKENLGKRQVDVIVGLRRVGKTVLMYQLIDHLLKSGVNPREIFYFSFDLEKRDLGRVVREYEERILRDRIRDRRVYLFLDEIHKLEWWEDKVKVLYDLNPKLKMVISGSASLNLMKGSGESLAGRARFHYLPPLTFREFLELTGEKIPGPEDFEIHKRRLNILLNRFMLRGFPETLGMSDGEAKTYVRELVVERIVFRDIPESFRVEDLEVLRLLANYIFENPGVILNVDSLSKDLGRHKKTIRNALSYLELSFLIKRVGNLRGSFLATSRKNRKAYPLHPCLAMTKDEDRLFETLIRSELNAEYYWRKGSYEVDFVLKNDGIIPIEVKNKERVTEADLKGIVRFCSMFKVKGYVINREEERVQGELAILPATKFLLFGKPGPLMHA